MDILPVVTVQKPPVTDAVRGADAITQTLVVPEMVPEIGSGLTVIDFVLKQPVGRM